MIWVLVLAAWAGFTVGVLVGAWWASRKRPPEPPTTGHLEIVPDPTVPRGTVLFMRGKEVVGRIDNIEGLADPRAE